MFETLGFEMLSAPQAAVYFGLAVGVCFGALAQRTRFCLRRAIAGDSAERLPAAGVWLMALAVAVIGTQAAVAAGWVSFAGHRQSTPALPVLALLTGGGLFGFGMVLTRGCASRLTVLSAQGNLRALVVLAVFAITAHAMLRGVLAPLRSALGSVTVSLDQTASLAALPGGGLAWGGEIAALSLAVALRSGAGALALAGAALIGLLVPLAWVGTGLVLFDDFDPIVMESLSFSGPWAESLFFVIASSSIPASFSTGLIGGTLLGALAMALAFGDFRSQMGRYLTGGAMMGAGGVLAGGCTVGAGLSGVPTLGVAALLALAAIVAGGFVGRALVTPSSSGSGAPASTHPG